MTDNYMYGNVEDFETAEEDRERLRWLDALEAAGVDNWDGIDYAYEIFNAFKT